MIKHREQIAFRTIRAGAVLAIVALSILLRSTQAGETPDDPHAIAAGTIQNWLQEIDQGKYAQSWQGAAPMFQKAISQEGWTAALNKVRTPLGRCVERKLASASRQANVRSPAGAQEGDFIVAQFETSFDGLKYAVETVTFARALDGAWEAAGYYIKPGPK